MWSMWHIDCEIAVDSGDKSPNVSPSEFWYLLAKIDMTHTRRYKTKCPIVLISKIDCQVAVDLVIKAWMYHLANLIFHSLKSTWPLQDGSRIYTACGSSHHETLTHALRDSWQITDVCAVFKGCALATIVVNCCVVVSVDKSPAGRANHQWDLSRSHTLNVKLHQFIWQTD